jgi:hypothetical protein
MFSSRRLVDFEVSLAFRLVSALFRPSESAPCRDLRAPFFIAVRLIFPLRLLMKTKHVFKTWVLHVGLPIMRLGMLGFGVVPGGLALAEAMTKAPIHLTLLAGFGTI